MKPSTSSGRLRVSFSSVIALVTFVTLFPSVFRGVNSPASNFIGVLNRYVSMNILPTLTASPQADQAGAIARASSIVLT
jgi:hypothetical protein